jgi:signal transduction histidine kinase
MNLKKRHTLFCRTVTLATLLLTPCVIQAQKFHFDNIFDFEHVLAYLVAGLLIGIFLLLFYNRLYVYREQDINKLQHSQNNRLAIIIQTGRMRMWIYDTITRHYRFISETGEIVQEYNPIDFSQFFNRDDFEVMRSSIFDICENRRITSTVNIRSNEVDKENIRYYEIHLSIAEKNFRGEATKLLGVQRDVTAEQEKKDNTNKLMMRYHTVFNSSLVDMLYYDKDGLLTNLNDTACKSFDIPNKEALIKEKHYFKENAFFNNIDFTKIDHTYMSSIIDIEEYDTTRHWTTKSGKTGKIYYEASVNTVHNEQGELEGVYIAGRNISEMVDSFHKQQEGAIALKKAIQHIQEYIDNINYALRISNVRMVDYNPQTYTFTLSNTIDKSNLRLSQLRCIRLAMPRYRRAVSSALNRMDHLTPHAIEQTIETEIRDEKRRQIALLFNMVPILDKDDKIEHYFGLCREMTDMLETERLLAIETKKAQEAELLKESFLTNMSYEIRTPLNSVLGFAELFEIEHDEADEPIFVEEIKRNTNTLLLLINDILYLSRIDADMVEFKHEDYDFAELFHSYCQMGWVSVRPEVRTSVEGPYEHLIINGDGEHLGKAIQMLCANAARFTQKGTIRAKYEYRREELVVIIEDTGDGIDPETLPKVFERFVRDKDERLFGTGLDLPIIEALIKKMGGSIELNSELGKGTTVWLFLPCHAKMIEKKSNIDYNTDPVIV